MRERPCSIRALHDEPARGDPAEEVERPAAARWLADDHFTFLGYREYRLDVDDDGEDVLARRARHRPGHPAPRPQPASSRVAR